MAPTLKSIVEYSKDIIENTSNEADWNFSVDEKPLNTVHAYIFVGYQPRV